MKIQLAVAWSGLLPMILAAVSTVTIRVSPGWRSVHMARDAARVALATSVSTGTVVEVVLGPGVHHIGDSPLVLGPRDGGADAEHSVVWRSADPANPAVVGAPIHVTGWQSHPTISGTLIAQLPANVSRNATLRHFWVNGERATRPTLYACGSDGNGGTSCNNATSSVPAHIFRFNKSEPTAMYPQGSAFDVSDDASVGDPRQWPNAGDVEFVWTSCATFNCWLEPRCGVESVTGNNVYLKQAEGNETCFHRAYYFGHGWGGKPEGKGPKAPTAIENLFIPAAFTRPGTWYYDRAAATILYRPRPGETVALIESTAITATAEVALVVNATANVAWKDVNFAYVTSLHASGPRGFIDTQSGYMYQDGEPPLNVHVIASHNVSFSGCDFRHMGAVYTLGANNASQNIVISNCTFADCSGGAIKLGNVGERGYPAPDPTTDPKLQDRGFLVSDCEMDSIPVEYGGTNPIFGGYIADTVLAHNTIKNSAYSGICLGWGWGLPSYMRNVHAFNNSITNPMLRLADGGGLYTNTPCPNCNVSGNVFENDNIEYGCLYHDGGSGQWYDTNNVFNHIHTTSVFGHGSCPDIIVNDIWMNDSLAPRLQGAVNMALRGENGTCTTPRFFTPPDGTTWTEWPDEAAAIVANAGRRHGSFPALIAPALSPPATKMPNGNNVCIRLGVQACASWNSAQKWSLSDGVTPGDGKLTVIRSAVPTNSTMHSCWKAQLQREKAQFGMPSVQCALHNQGVMCEDGCMPLPPHANAAASPGCPKAGAWFIHSNGTITNAQVQFPSHGAPYQLCISAGDQLGSGTAISVTPCTGSPNQIWRIVSRTDGTFEIEQNRTCVTNNFREGV